MAVHQWVLFISTLTLVGCSLDFGVLTRTQPLRETVLEGDSGPKIPLIEIEGIISDERRQLPFGFSEPSLVAHVREALDRAKEDDDVAALILRVRSPGGTVAASETLHHEILRWKAETSRPVIAFLQGTATSGAYYISMAADVVVAHPMAVTGSIGVIMPGVNLSGLMERFGVSDQTFTSGPFKDSGSPLREMRDEERDWIQGVIEELYQRFVEVVQKGRPALQAAAVQELADGRIFSASQALDAGLIDAIGHLELAVETAERRAQIPSSRVISYHRPDSYRSNIYSHSSGWVPPRIELNLIPRPRLETGFYYLWPLVLAGP